MSIIADVAIHSSQFPESVRSDLLESLRTRRVNHKFHYDSVKQTQKWLALHDAYSPCRNDTDCAAIYDQCFKAALEQIKAKQIHVIGLGCGGGQKDAQLLKLLAERGIEMSYTPCDVSVAMVLVARQATLSLVKHCHPLVCDLATADDLLGTLCERIPQDAPRLTTFFGMIPNFEPEVILPKLAAFVRRSDCLLFSANLAPGTDYAAGMEKILPQYDNALTRDWLMTFLLDLGVDRDDGELRFTTESGGVDLKRVMVRFVFRRERSIAVGSESFRFCRGEAIQLFFSYRYTPERIVEVLGRHELTVLDQRVATSGEEGVFLCARQ
jgi:uncharacterized SAM-dependent methyltransferase